MKAFEASKIEYWISEIKNDSVILLDDLGLGNMGISYTFTTILQKANSDIKIITLLNYIFDCFNRNL